MKEDTDILIYEIDKESNKAMDQLQQLLGFKEFVPFITLCVSIMAFLTTWRVFGVESIFGVTIEDEKSVVMQLPISAILPNLEEKFRMQLKELGIDSTHKLTIFEILDKLSEYNKRRGENGTP